MKTKEEVFLILKNTPIGNIEEINFKKKFPNLYQEIQSWFFPINFKWTQKLYHFFNNDPDLKLGICQMDGCNNRCNFLRFNRGYKKHCSKECAWKDDKTLKKRIETNLKIYGKEYSSQTEECKKKTNDTNYKKYGCKRYSQTKECKNRVKETNKNLFGVEYYSQTEECKNRVKETNKNLFGVEYYSQTQESKDKCKKTCLEKYGVEHYSKTNEYKDKVAKTNLELYGNKCSLHGDEIGKKVKDTIIERYGTEYYLQSDDYKQKSIDTCLDKYGVEHYTQTNEYKEKIKQTCLEKYGYEHYTQSREYAKFHKKRVNYDDLMFDSSWEVIVYKFCNENNIECEYQPDIQFEYEYGGKRHIYQPDFLICGKIYEVKGDQFFDGDKMINPYDRNQDGLFEAKHQCMIDNGVIVLKGKDILNIDMIMKGTN